jgi:ABC-2 type transport system permease protein
VIVFERLKHMLIKEFIQIFRDPRMRTVIFLMPIIQVIIFGYAVSTDVRNIRTALYDLDNTPASRELASRFEGSGYFDIVQRVKTETEVEEAVDSGRAKAVLRLNRGFSEAITGGRTAGIQLILDGSDSNTVDVVLAYAGRIAAAYNGRILMERIAKSGKVGFEAEPMAIASRAWFNPNLESRFFFLPGVIAQLVMILSIILSSMAIVREREIGTMEQIMVTPIGRMEFVLGKTIPFALIGFVDVALISAIAVFWFQVPLEGSLLTLLFATGLFLLSTLGVGLFISTASQTQQQAMMTAFFFAMPAILLSGFIYPIANMPVVIQWVTCLNPLRYFLVIIRGIYLKGTGFRVLWPQMAALAILGLVMLFLAASRFKKTMV